VERNSLKGSGLNGQQHVGATAKSVAEHASTLTRLELELAALELKRKATALGVGAGMAAGAALLAMIGIAFVFVTATIALSLVMPTWLASLIVTAVLFGSAALLGLLAYGSFRKGTPPVPEQALEQAKLTTEAIKR
jgi:hypothetical protein